MARRDAARRAGRTPDERGFDELRLALDAVLAALAALSLGSKVKALRSAKLGHLHLQAGMEALWPQAQRNSKQEGGDGRVQ